MDLIASGEATVHCGYPGEQSLRWPATLGAGE